MGPCWHYVGSFFALGRLFFTLERLSHVCWAFFYSRSTFFSRFGWLRVGCLGIQGQFRGSETTFFGVLSSAQVCNAKKLRMCKNHSFSCVFVWFLHIASFVFKPQNNAKSFPGPVQQSFLQRLCSSSVLKWILESLVLSGAPLDWLLFALGRLLASLGRFLGVSWALLGRSWLPLGCSVELHGCIWVPWAVPGLDFKGFGDVPD